VANSKNIILSCGSAMHIGRTVDLVLLNREHHFPGGCHLYQFKNICFLFETNFSFLENENIYQIFHLLISLCGEAL
jgi:hypothetical protein